MEDSRRAFLKSISILAAGSFLPLPSWGFGLGGRKLKVALVGTGIRGTSYWGKELVEKYPDDLEFVGLCDINPGRLEYARKYMQVNCPTFTNFTEMVTESEPDLVIVTTVDSTHHEFIVKGLEMGCDVLSEKPLTTDEQKCQEIIDAESQYDKKLIVGFNYRWSPYNTKVKELISEGAIGKVTSVDFHWYLNTYHGASYFRRWHGLREKGGTLLVHKSTHHFDLLNWWLDSDPKEVFAYGDLEFYGHNNPFRGDFCRVCPHKSNCDFYWDITKDTHLMNLYVENEEHDGYIRDNCVWAKEINIYDKMSAQIKYMNNVVVNYSLTTYSPFEGWRIAFNGTKGRIEASLDIPYTQDVKMSQEELHAAEMSQEKDELSLEPVITHKLWEDFETVEVPMERSGHGGGDKRLHEQVFEHPEQKDPYDRAAGLRDGAMSVLVGVAARKSIESGRPVQIADLTDLKPQVKRMLE
ncbi:Gfo/Idh/MocA family oxidoreductase [Autumnicola psychrophila]|uniref:Gfo/Idh/MocA family oxidoreductase n=1 Tax=Autumnicola psychrophila TaxID=3075592 RepID=A0ABU3DTF6_9FLAO|nr:Gfo/Idh/MocA family oxidoreductase [Zunongwangia sp. F225]MDT0686994.1 Gfo/Idh/MocA family oxidoreductase [Zunongwangia sp. F225]